MESKIIGINKLSCKKVLLISCVVSFIILGCSPARQNTNYAYKSELYEIVNNVRKDVSFGTFISYDNVLFEFIIKRSDSSEIISDSEWVIRSTTYDTTGVYLLSTNSKYYIQFDTFNVKSNIVKAGRLENKPKGEKLATMNTEIQSFDNRRLKDTLLFGQPYFYWDTASVVKEMDDTAEVRLFFIKNRNFNSIYKIYGSNLSNREFCMAGVGVYYRKANSNTMFIIKDIRPTSKSEEKICEALLKKARYAITDTIK